MKKLLACLLTAMLLFAVAAVPVSAIPPQPDWPPVVAIEAEWNGEFYLLNRTGDALTPWFNPLNVVVTVHFEEEDPIELTEWDRSAVFMGVITELDLEAHIVRFFYFDDHLRNVYAGSYIESGSFTDSFLATLPQTSVEFPANFVELFIEQHRPMPELRLDEEARGHAFAFTAQENRAHYFWTEPGRLMTILDSDLEIVFSERGTGFTRVVLEAGETYYVLFTNTHIRFENTITASYNPPPQPNYTLWQRIWARVLDRIDWLRGIFGL